MLRVFRSCVSLLASDRPDGWEKPDDVATVLKAAKDVGIRVEIDGDLPESEYGQFMDSNGNAWCTEFISWCLRMANVPEDVIASSNSANVKKFKAPYITWEDMIHSAFFYGAKDLGDKVAIRLLEGNTDDMVTTEIIYVDPKTGYLLEEPYENGERLRIGAIITPEYGSKKQ